MRTLTLNRPRRRNALSLELMRELIAALDDAASSDARVVVLRGEGPAFSAGHDLGELGSCELDEAREIFRVCADLMLAIHRLPQPVVARVHGIATAAGCQLVSMCDLAVASDTATFALPGVNVGIFCTTPAVGVARNVARKRVMEMLLTGRPIDAPTALAWGLVNRVVPAADLDAAIQDFVGAILSKSPAVIGAGKRTFYEQIDRSLGGAYEVAGPAMTRGALLEDAAEGIDAFLQKRPAEWRGR